MTELKIAVLPKENLDKQFNEFRNKQVILEQWNWNFYKKKIELMELKNSKEIKNETVSLGNRADQLGERISATKIWKW